MMNNFWEPDSWWGRTDESPPPPRDYGPPEPEPEWLRKEAAQQEDIQDIRNLLEDALHHLSRGQVATARADIQAALDRLPSL